MCIFESMSGLFPYPPPIVQGSIIFSGKNLVCQYRPSLQEILKDVLPAERKSYTSWKI